MERYTNKQLRELVKYGQAADVTHKPFRSAIPETFEQVGYSAGVYGCNGALLKGESGALYVVTKRCAALWIFT